MTFIVNAEGEQVNCDGVYDSGTVTATMTVPLSDYIEISALIVNGGTTKQEKLDDIHGLLDMHILDVDGHGRISSTRTLGNDKLTMSGEVYVNIHSKIYDESKPVKSRVSSAVLEFVENGKVTNTVDLLKDAKPDFIFTEMFDLNYDVGTIERNVKVGDVFEFVVTIVDDNGVIYKGIVEGIEITDDKRVDQSLSNRNSFEITLPDKVE